MKHRSSHSTDRAATDRDAPEAQFEEAERAALAALDRAGIASHPERLIATLRDLIALYERRAEQLCAERVVLWRRERRDDERQAAGLDDLRRLQRQRWERDGDARREDARAVARLHREQLALYARLLDCQERALGRQHPDLAATLLAMAAIQWQHFDEFGAFPLLRRALAIRERALGADHPETLALVRQLASWYSILCSFAAAAPLWRRLLARAERDFAAAPASNAQPLREVLGWLAEAYTALPDPGAAEQTWRRFLALPSPTTSYGTLPARCPDYPDSLRLRGLYGVGRACAAQGKWREAAVALREALALHERYPDYVLAEQQGTRRLGLDTGLHDYAAILRQLGRPEEALPRFARALDLNQQTGLRFATLLRDYATTLRDLRRPDEAAALERRAEGIEAEFAARRARLRW